MNEAFRKVRRRRLLKTEKSYPTRIREELIIDFFNENNQLDYTVSEISRAMGEIYNSIKYHIQQMEQEGTLVRVRPMGNGHTYQLAGWLNDEGKKKEEVSRHKTL